MKLFGILLSRHGVAALFLSMLLAACTVVENDGPRPRPPRPDPNYICVGEYQPVCARKGGDRQTFANQCRASMAGYRILRPGRCEYEGNRGRPSFCTREYAPVCATRLGSARTFPNACEARAANWRIVDNEPC